MHSLTTLETRPVLANITNLRSNLSERNKERLKKHGLSDERDATVAKRTKSHTSYFQQSLLDYLPSRHSVHTKVASDVIRASLVPGVNLEDFVSQCQRTDYSMSAVNRTSTERLYEGTDYLLNIVAYERMREQEERFQCQDFLNSGRQPNITPDMLALLADWMVDLEDHFSLNHETVHLTWSLLFAFFDKCPNVQRSEIQLMACASIMIACKLEEHQTPLLDNLVYFTDNTYTKEELLLAEHKLLRSIDFNVHRPNPYIFLRRFARVLDANSEHVQYMCRFLLEAGMHCYSISLVQESKKAAACLWLARVVLCNPSYKHWALRSEVRKVKHCISANPSAFRIYRQASLNHSLNSSATSSTSAASLSHTFSCPTPSPGVSANASFAEQNSSAPATPVNLSQRGAGSDNTEPLDLAPRLSSRIEELAGEEAQLRPFWPPILHQITGFRETELIPLALRYHMIAIALIAETANGAAMANRSGVDDENSNSSLSNHTNSSSASGSGDSHLKKHLVTKYCSRLFHGVAKEYTRLAYDNLVPHFSSLQCPNDCQCYICVNLLDPHPKV